MAARAGSLYTQAEAGACTLVIVPITVAEVVWILSSFYHRSPAEIAAAIRLLLMPARVEARELPCLLAALSDCEVDRVGSGDAPLAAKTETTGVVRVHSFDRHSVRMAAL